MGNIFLVYEINRYVLYYEKDNNVQREEFYSQEEAITRFDGGNIIAVSPADPRLKEIRNKYVSSQLNGDLLSYMSDPLDDSKVCNTIMGMLFSKPFFNVRSLRLMEDSRFNYLPARTETKEKVIVSLLKCIFNNYDYLNDRFNVLNNDTARWLYGIRDDDSKLLEVAKKMIQLDSFYEENALHPEIVANKDLFNIFKNLLDFRSEHTGAYSHGPYVQKYTEIIYLNCHNEDILLQFMGEYAKECLNNNINYDCKGLFNSGIKSADTTILYSTHDDLKTKLMIIENIMEKHPDWREQFEQPVYGTSKVGSGFYGVCHSGLKMNTYNDYFQNVCIQARNSLVASILIQKGMIPPTHTNYQQLYKLANIQDLTPSDISIDHIRIGTLTLDSLKDILEPYLGNPSIQKELTKVNREEFKRRVRKIHTVNSGIDPSLDIPVTISGQMIEHFRKPNKYTDSVDDKPKQVEDIESFVWPKPLPSIEPKVQVQEKTVSIKERLRELLYRIKINGHYEVEEVLSGLYENLCSIDDAIIDERIVQIIEKIMEEYKNYKNFISFASARDMAMKEINQGVAKINELVSNYKKK